MCKFKELKPNLKVIILFLDNKKKMLDIQSKINNNQNILKTKNNITVNELGKELDINITHIRKYLKELEELGFINTFKSKGKIEVLL